MLCENHFCKTVTLHVGKVEECESGLMCLIHVEERFPDDKEGNWQHGEIFAKGGRPLV